MSSGKTVNTAAVKKALAKSQPIFNPNSHPRVGFYGRTKNQTTPVPCSGTFNGGKDIRMIRKSSYLPNTAMADFFLFQSGGVEPADLSLSQGGLMTNLDWVA
jgi:hypothetical protein